MDIAFIGDKDKFVVIYLDEITIFSKSDKEHCHHLKKFLLKCRRFGLSLNPKKYFFAMKEGKLLGHIVSSKGVRINSSLVEAIQTLSFPISKNGVQSFLGKINFLRSFISNLAVLVKHITTMLGKGSKVKWTTESINSFEEIKMAFTEATVLTIPDYYKEFPIFSFASFDTWVVVLLHKNIEGLRMPISFFSRALRDVEMRYDSMENKASSLVKSIKAFRVYVMHSNIVAYVPSTSIK
jgi:hypothetical protein